MRTRANIPVWAYKLAIVAATVVWGGSFTVLKGALNAMPPGWLLGIRFAASAAAVALLFHRRVAARANRAHLLAGLALGITAGAAYLVQNVGLTNTTPGKNAFLTATYCVMVPFMNAAVARRAPALRNVLAACACTVGVALVAMGGAGNDVAAAGAVGAGAEAATGAAALAASAGDVSSAAASTFAALASSFAFTVGDALTLVGAVLFAVNIVQVAHLDEGIDIFVVTAVELATCSAVALAWGVVAEPAPTAAVFTRDFWAQMAYLVLLSTVFATVVQNVAQRHVPPAQAALLLSLESVFGAVFSIAFYGERVTLPLVAGFALIFASVVISELTTS